MGGPGNRAATEMFATAVSAFGFTVETPTFDCIDWEEDGADLRCGDAAFTAYPSPYALGCRVRAPLSVVSTVAELAAAELEGRILLLRGPIAAEQLMPKNFPFYNPDHHRRIIGLLEEKRPAAIVAATGRNPEVAGGLYPFPLIEDGDFDLPSVYMTEEEGERLAACAGETVFLHSRARRIPATGSNVIGRKSVEGPHLVFFAHIDAKMGAPGAADNAAGVIVMLLLAELLDDYEGELGVEIVALNGEDYYSNPGEQQYLAGKGEDFRRVVLGVNVDGVGYHRGQAAYSLYNCPPPVAAAVGRAFEPYAALVPGDAWYQGDHHLFLMNQVPALALTSDQMDDLLQIAHTAEDTPDKIDAAQLVTVALGLRDLVAELGNGNGDTDDTE